jgi:hypothetical protein
MLRLLALSAFALGVILARLPLIRDPIDVRPDGGEYLGIARHFAWEGRWESDIKWHFTTDEPVRHGALGDRPPLYPLVAAAAVRLSRDPARQVYAARFLNGMLAALAAVLAWLLLAAEFGEATAWISVLLFSLLPQNLRYGSQPLSEMLFLALLAGALLAWRAAATRAAPGYGAAAGFLLGLAYLTHAAGLVAFAVVGAAACLSARRATGRARIAAALAAGFLAAAAPYWIALYYTYGSPLYSALRLNFSVAHIHDAIYRGYEQQLPGPAAFVAGHPALVARLVGRQASIVFGTLFDTLLYLLPLALLMRRRDLAGQRGLYLALALALAAAHSLAWVTWGAARYMLPADLLLIPILIQAPLARALPRPSSLVVGHSSAVIALAAGLLVAIAAVQSAADLWRGSGIEQARWPWLLLPGIGAVLVLSQALRSSRSRTSGFQSLAASGQCPAPGSRLYLWLLAASVALAAASAGRLTFRLYREKAHPDLGFPDTALKREAVAWLATVAKTGGLVATNEPWIVNLLTEHPAVVLPWLRDPAQARRFLARFRPDYVILIVADPPGQPPDAAEFAQRFFGSDPPTGPVSAWLPLRWRIVELRTGPHPGQLLLILTPGDARQAPGAEVGPPGRVSRNP